VTAAPSGGDGASPIPRTAARAIALDRDLTHTALRVYTYLQSILGYKLLVGIAQKHIAEELGVRASEVDAALRVGGCVKRRIFGEVIWRLKMAYNLRPVEPG
jgi:hypothetical protein